MQQTKKKRRTRLGTYPVSDYDLIDGNTNGDAVEIRRISFSVDVRLQSAVQEKDNYELCCLLSTYRASLNINTSNHVGMTVLHQAVLNNNLDSVKLLLSHGADPDISDINGFSSLHTASACGYRNIASLLIINGGNLFQRTLEGDYPVTLANDGVTADLLATEMSSQLQNRILLENYGFLYKCIDLYHYIKTNTAYCLKLLLQWVTQIRDFIASTTDKIENEQGNRKTTGLIKRVTFSNEITPPSIQEKINPRLDKSRPMSITTVTE
ncbi:protein phosphatase 1 regulatory subunit 12A-like isoform X2 [Anneissia japonica]|nr:protein phosphatase 1 regulatory subunit 12A-like isoform X2 [Anneissia japonica]XP_033110870.1 protein phosphatase 1 regulatory subunit 12A-like isoform X2 [Anneissia japonica]XP_033110871.1 protein phosphatase 1 regulatory subunit 12A-like isoform X2 [Anneissia japonica]